MHKNLQLIPTNPINSVRNSDGVSLIFIYFIILQFFGRLHSFLHNTYSFVCRYKLFLLMTSVPRWFNLSRFRFQAMIIYRLKKGFVLFLRLLTENQGSNKSLLSKLWKKVQERVETILNAEPKN